MSETIKDYWTYRRFTDDVRTDQTPRPSLNVPLKVSQVEAAEAIYQKCMDDWRQADESLALLGQKLPSNTDVTQVLLKVVAVNSLYSTNLYAVQRMARHIAKVMSDSALDSITLVEHIARLPAEGDGKPRIAASFASKYVHWFVDPECPILDTQARHVVDLHLGTKTPESTGEHRHYAFCRDIETLRDLAGLRCKVRELDRYLWIRGQCEQWERNGPATPVNGEVKRFCESDSPGTRALRRGLLDIPA